MKSCIRTLLALCAAFLLTACATSEPTSTQYRFQLADSYMQAVERNARHKGIDVVWINAPARSPVKEAESGGD